MPLKTIFNFLSENLVKTSYSVAAVPESPKQNRDCVWELFEKQFIVFGIGLVVSGIFFSFSLAQENAEQIISERLETLPLPDPAEFYGQRDDFAKAVEENYCDTAKTQGNMYLGKEGWIFNRVREIDFGREQLSIDDLEYSDIVFWLSEYRKALETVGFKDTIMLIVPPKGLLGEAYLSEELKTFLAENKTEEHYQEMRQSYLEAGFEHVPDLLEVIRNSNANVFPFYPVDHHFTPYTASLFAAEAARGILENEVYAELPKTSMTAVIAEDIFTVTGWEHETQVENACGTDIPSVFKPYYDLEYPETQTLLGEEKPEIILAGNSHIGYQFNRAGTDGGYQTPGTGLSSFLAHLTHLPVLNYAVYSLQNAAIEMYLRTDFMSEVPPSYLVQLLEAHAYPFPAYNYRALPALTYGKCSEPVFEGALTRADFWRLGIPTTLSENSSNYYLWLELEADALKHTEWKLDESYSSGEKTITTFTTDDRFIHFPRNFGLQLLPGQGNLENIRVTAEGGWEGNSISVRLCDIQQVQKTYQALQR